MSSSDRTLPLSLVPEAPPTRAPDGGEPSTRRMTPDEVRALLSRMECGSTSACNAGDPPRTPVRGVADLADASELPTLLYRPRKQLTRAMLRLDATDCPADSASPTLFGLGPTRTPRIVFAERAVDPAADDDDWDDWVATSDLRPFALDEGNAADAPAYQAAVTPPAPRPSPLSGEASPPAATASAEAPANVRAERLRASLATRSRRLAWLVVALLAASPAIVALVRWASTAPTDTQAEGTGNEPASAGGDVRPAPRVSDAGDVTMMGEGETSADVGLPRALQASARALEAAGPTDAAARVRRAALAGATEQLLAGETIEALAALRALSQGEPQVPMLGLVVRQLERQLHACAARGGSACR